MFVENLFFFMPEMNILLVIIFGLVYGIFNHKKKKKFIQEIVFLCSSAIIYSIGMLLYIKFYINNDIYYPIHFQFVTDTFSINMRLILLIFSLIIFLFSYNYFNEYDSFEIPIMMLMAIFGMCFIVSSNDFILLYLAIELQSLIFFVLASSKKNSNLSTEAGLKYFILSAFASGLLLFGISIVYGFLGITNFMEIQYLLMSDVIVIKNGLLLGFAFIIIGLLFKLPSAPFHNWAPDVYDGSPLLITSFFAIVPKIAIFSVVFRLLYGPFYIFIDYWSLILIICSILSLIIGCLGALYQVKIKRFIAYSSITHIGFILVALSSGTIEGLQNSMFYLIIYLLLNVNFFCILFIFKNLNFNLETINDFIVLSKHQPILGVAFSLNLFSMAGIPPLAGFFSKFYVLFTAIKSEMYFLSLLAVLVSVISCVYYIRIIKIMLFDNDNNSYTDTYRKIKIPMHLNLILYFGLFVNLLIFIFSDYLLKFCLDSILVLC